MERYNQIIHNPVFTAYMARMGQLEQNRRFCRHDLTHLLDVCRVAYIFALEEGVCEVIGGKDVIYGAGLLHDLGRVAQYEKGTPHEKESIRLAGEILPDCNYKEEEIKKIQAAIGLHRRGKEISCRSSVPMSMAAGIDLGAELLSAHLYRADKAVRNCFCCGAWEECSWKENRKNQGIV